MELNPTENERQPGLKIALYKPEIPQNTGNIGRLSICTGTELHIVGEPSFRLDDAAVKRAGIDYWHRVKLTMHQDWDDFFQKLQGLHNNRSRIVTFTRFAKKNFYDYTFNGDEYLLFGSETSGLPPGVIEDVKRFNPEGMVRLPVSEDCRSLNLSNSVAIAVYEALRQTGFRGLQKTWEGSSL